jgi:hypothetical protein
MEIVANFVLSKTIITINTWKVQFPSIRVFAAEMLENMFGPNKYKLSK